MGGSPPKDNSAELARKREEERQANIRAGRARIDDTFATFDDAYFNDYSDAYTGHYFPQLEDKYEDARRKLALQLSGSGRLNSSAGAKSFGDLTEAYSQNRTQIADQALAAANALRGDVESARSDLYSQNTASADPSAAASSALARVSVLDRPPAYNPLGDIFASFLDTAATAVSAEKAGYRGFNTGLFQPKSSAKVVQ
jgi:hypothetical protein